MILPAGVASTPLDDFLAGSSSSTDTGELLQRVGLFGSLFGLTLAAGLVVFLAVAHRGSRREVGMLLRLAAAAGAIATLGAVIEVAGIATIDDLSWSDALSDGAGSSSMMRLLGGLLIALGLFDHTVEVDDTVDVEVDETTEVDDAVPAEHTPDDVEPDVRWVPAPASAFGYVGVLVGILSFWFDGHTVSEGPRVVHALVNLVHVGAASVWFGGIVGLALVAWARRSSTSSVAPVIVRFSTVASVALVLVALAGALMTLMIIDDVGDLTGSEWGRLLLVKTAAVAVVAAIGGYNHFVAVPALERAPDAERHASTLRFTVTVEAILLAFVVAITVLLSVASTN